MARISVTGLTPVAQTDPNTLTRATITQVDASQNICVARDTLGKEYTIPLDLRPKGSSPPAEGELWMIEKKFQKWTLMSMVGHPAQPVITGTKTAKDTIALQLLNALSELGLIDDQTT